MKKSQPLYSVLGHICNNLSDEGFEELKEILCSHSKSSLISHMHGQFAQVTIDLDTWTSDMLSDTLISHMRDDPNMITFVNGGHKIRVEAVPTNSQVFVYRNLKTKWTIGAYISFNLWIEDSNANLCIKEADVFGVRMDIQKRKRLTIEGIWNTLRKSVEDKGLDQNKWNIRNSIVDQYGEDIAEKILPMLTTPCDSAH